MLKAIRALVAKHKKDSVPAALRRGVKNVCDLPIYAVNRGLEHITGFDASVSKNKDQDEMRKVLYRGLNCKCAHPLPRRCMTMEAFDKLVVDRYQQNGRLLEG